MSDAMRWPGRSERWQTAVSVLVAVLPKCPLCAAAHTALLGSMGLGGVASAPWMRWLAAALVVLAVGLLARGAHRRRGYGPFALGCAGGLVVIAELFHRHAPEHAHHAAAAHPQWPVWMGIGALVAASLWNAWPRRASACPSTEPRHCAAG